MIPRVTVKQMLAARMGVEDHNDTAIYEACDTTRSMLMKWRDDPEFQAYEESVRFEHDCRMKAATQIEAKKYKITLAGVIEELQKIACVEIDPKKVTASDKIKALLSQVDLLQLKPEASEADPDRPSIYKPAWMETQQ